VPRQTKGAWAERRDALIWLAVLAVLGVAAAWLQHHPWVLIGVGRSVRGYLMAGPSTSSMASG
jgi:4-hydroxybenzoate polyprenyltransferase